MERKWILIVVSAAIVLIVASRELLARILRCIQGTTCARAIFNLIKGNLDGRIYR